MIGTGLEKVDLLPSRLAVSLVKGAVASNVPFELHRSLICVPVFSDPFVEAYPVIFPDTSSLNLR